MRFPTASWAHSATRLREAAAATNASVSKWRCCRSVSRERRRDHAAEVATTTTKLHRDLIATFGPDAVVVGLFTIFPDQGRRLALSASSWSVRHPSRGPHNYLAPQCHQHILPVLLVIDIWRVIYSTSALCLVRSRRNEQGVLSALSPCYIGRAKDVGWSYFGLI
jgi:hypothetical protein